MLKIDRNKKTLANLEAPTLSALAITERSDLQEFIYNSPQAFFQEIGLELFLIGKEVPPSTNVQDRIDLLAVDRVGNAVVIELKRGNHKLHLLQAIAYAGMINKWSWRDFQQQLSRDRQQALEEFLECEPENVNRRQRLILVAEAYDFEVLIAAEWLTEQYGVDVLCCRLSVAKDPGTGAEYLACSNIFPAPELAGLAISRSHGKSVVEAPWPDWDTALSSVTNEALVDFFRKELANGQEAYLPKQVLYYRVNGDRRWFVAAREKYAYVWQYTRFHGDVEFWKEGLAEPGMVTTVKDGAGLRFRLITASDFQFFKDAASDKLAESWSAVRTDAKLDDAQEDPHDKFITKDGDVRLL